MARARNLKHGFFTNEELAGCTLAARLCFAGLWLLADREGRLEDRPRRIKAELFAYDDFPIEPLLEELAQHNFILRYDAEGMPAIQILAFKKHQTPHYSEKPSVIKPPPLQESERIKPPPLQEDSRSPPSIKRGSQPQMKRGSQPPESGFLNPESCNLNPELSATAVADVGGKTADASPQGVSKLNGHGQHEAADLPECPHQAILALFARELPELPQPRAWTKARSAHLRARWRDAAVMHGWADEDDGLQYFERLFRYIRGSDFLMGQAPPGRGRATPFALELAWLVDPENWAKVTEGRYHPAVHA